VPKGRFAQPCCYYLIEGRWLPRRMEQCLRQRNAYLIGKVNFITHAQFKLCQEEGCKGTEVLCSICQPNK
jgi:uncharacterized protein YchJ